MARPSFQVVAGWVCGCISPNWQELSVVAKQAVSQHWTGHSEMDCADLAEEYQDRIAEHLRNEFAFAAAAGAVRQYEIDEETPAYIRGALTDAAVSLRNRMHVMNPLKFEEICSRILVALGGFSEVTRASHDGGVDFFARRLSIVPRELKFPNAASVIVVGQAKRYANGHLVTEKELRGFVGAGLLRLYELGIQHACGAFSPSILAFWTTSSFDPRARLFGEKCGVWLMDGPTLVDYVLRLSVKTDDLVEQTAA